MARVVKEWARMLDETIARLSTTDYATTGVPDEPPSPREPPSSRVPEDDDEGDDVPATPPTEPPPVPIQDPPAEPGGDSPQIV